MQYLYLNAAVKKKKKDEKDQVQMLEQRAYSAITLIL